MLSILLGQLAEAQGRLPCPICRKQVFIPEEGFPVCFISDYIREQLKNPSSACDNGLLTVYSLQFTAIYFHEENHNQLNWADKC